MENEKGKLIIDGNAFYELDLNCLKEQAGNRKDISKKQSSVDTLPQKRQRK